jgi:microcin C transport system permease protein
MPSFILMREYILRRILLIPLTFVGITFIAFLMTRLVPGGPIERAMAEKLQAKQKFTLQPSSSGPASPEELDNLKRQYGFDRPLWEAYAIWLGVYPGPTSWAVARLNDNQPTLVEVKSSQKSILLSLQPKPEGKWEIRDSQKRLLDDWVIEDAPLPQDPNPARRIIVYQPQLNGIIQGNFGTSTQSDKSVLLIIAEKIPLSAWFGFWGMTLAYLIAVPLGIYKAKHHNQWSDTFSSSLLFFGFAIPGFILALASLYLLCFQIPLFPHSGFNWDEPIRSTILPLVCQTVGAFASMTLFMKNSLMDQLQSDYMRTAKAKGVSETRRLYVHALRNSLIPLAANFGQNIGFFLTGSFLIEYTFDIDGIGLLSYDALVQRDFPVFLGLLTLSSLVLLIGNILSDLCVAAVDPRIRFEK